MVQVVKCSDRTCCSQHRSSYFSLTEDGFLAGSLLNEQTLENGLRVAVGSSRFPSLFVRLAVNADILPRSAVSYPKEIPFDFARSNLQHKLTQRDCKQCLLYHASVKYVEAHEKVCKVSAQSSTQDTPAAPRPRVKPVRVAAKRQREPMCVIQDMDDVDLE